MSIDVLILPATFTGVAVPVLNDVTIPLPKLSVGAVTPGVVVAGAPVMATPVLHTGTLVPAGVVDTGVSIPTPALNTGSVVVAPSVVNGAPVVPLPTFIGTQPTNLRQNTADGGSNASPVLAGDTGSGYPFDQVTLTGNGSAIYDSTVKLHGANSYRVTAAAGESSILIWVGGSDTQGAQRFYLYLRSLPAATGDVAHFRNNATVAAKVQIDATGHLIAANSVGTPAWTAAAALSLTTWYRVEWQVQVGAAGSGIIRVQYFLGDSTTPIETLNSSTSNTGGALPIETTRWGKLTSATTTLDANIETIAWSPGTLVPIGPYATGGVNIQPAVVLGSTSIPRAWGYGMYVPDNTTSGITVLPSTLARLNFPGSSQFVPVANTEYVGYEVFGDMKITAANNNVKFRNCLIRGAPTFDTNFANDSAIINGATPGTGRGWEFLECTIMPQVPQYLRNGFIGCGFRFERCRIIWTNDGGGIYQTVFTGSLNGDAVILGCYISDTVYWHGSRSQYGSPTNLPQQSTANMLVTLPGPNMDYTGGTVSVPNYGPIKIDGTHNDGFHLQGVRGPARTVVIRGNRINNNDAEQLVPVGGSDPTKHPIGWDTPWPTLGSQDCQKRYREISGQGAADSNVPDTTAAVVLNRLPNGQFSANGCPIILTQVTVAYPQVDTVVIEDNFFDVGNFILNAHGVDSYGIGEQFTFQRNRIGPNTYNASTTAPTGKAWYVVRIDSQSHVNAAGLTTNYYHPAGYGKADGTFISAGTPQSGNGIVYDTP